MLAGLGAPSVPGLGGGVEIVRAFPARRALGVLFKAGVLPALDVAAGDGLEISFDWTSAVSFDEAAWFFCWAAFLAEAGVVVVFVLGVLDVFVEATAFLTGAFAAEVDFLVVLDLVERLGFLEAGGSLVWVGCGPGALFETRVDLEVDGRLGERRPAGGDVFPGLIPYNTQVYNRIPRLETHDTLTGCHPSLSRRFIKTHRFGS
jgi:hypothetical protein